VLTGSVEKTKTTFRRKPHVSPTLKTVLVIENAEKVLGSQQPGRPLASNDPVPSTLPSPKPGRFSDARPTASRTLTSPAQVCRERSGSPGPQLLGIPRRHGGL
jgi:hypothetical protein